MFLQLFDCLFRRPNSSPWKWGWQIHKGSSESPFWAVVNLWSVPCTTIPPTTCSAMLLSDGRTLLATADAICFLLVLLPRREKKGSMLKGNHGIRTQSYPIVMQPQCSLKAKELTCPSTGCSYAPLARWHQLRKLDYYWALRAQS